MRPSTAQLPSAGPWIVSPAFDLLFFVNVAWLLALLPAYGTTDGGTHLDFWQVFFITTPHRWITLGLVAVDPDRRVDRKGWFLTLALVAFVAVWGVWLAAGTFRCLVLIDVVWNGWHFASQHSGIARIYGRKSGGRRRWLDIYALRTFVFFITLRLVGSLTGWLENVPDGDRWLLGFDRAWLALGALILAVVCVDRPWLRPGRVAYVTSVVCLYGVLLWAVSERRGDLVARLVVASALFHAVEYLAIVTHYAWQRRSQGSAGLFREMAGRWLLVLAAFVLLLGLVASYAESAWRELWAGMNLWAAYLHYAFDGMIWKLRKPATAAALGASPAAVPAGG